MDGWLSGKSIARRRSKKLLESRSEPEPQPEPPTGPSDGVGGEGGVSWADMVDALLSAEEEGADDDL